MAAELEPLPDSDSDLEAETGAGGGGGVVGFLMDAITFTIVTVKLAAASTAMLWLSRTVQGAYDYVEECAAHVDGQMDLAESLNVDPAVVGAHRDAATVMREILDDAEALAEEAQQMAADFQAAKEGHEEDYGPVAEAMNNKPGQVADSSYYANR
ncbi:hypothetical protein ACFY1V_31625 [Streptomyces sp. NPDC001255]|uniref:hypothetical protein n=1 Tax=Streptomyces sp. NPDC001255 TaxID=3364550 RepID=UPI0036C9C3A2